MVALVQDLFFLLRLLLSPARSRWFPSRGGWVFGRGSIRWLVFITGLNWRVLTGSCGWVHIDGTSCVVHPLGEREDIANLSFNLIVWGNDPCVYCGLDCFDQLLRITDPNLASLNVGICSDPREVPVH